MRVSTNLMYQTSTNNVVNGQASLYKTGNQLSTGRRTLTPRDDPVDSAQALLINQSKEVNATFLKNQGMASDHLAYLDGQLNSVSEILQDAMARGVQGGNASYSAEQKGAIAEELKRRLEALVDLANSRDGMGEYVFAGNRTNVKPFDVTGSGGNYALNPAFSADPAAQTYVSYNGDDGRRQLQVESSQTVPTSESGQDIFMRVMDAGGNLTGRSVFDSLKNMIDALDPASGVVPAPSFDQALADLHTTIDHISRVRATVGSHMGQMDSLTSADGDLAVQYEARLGKLESLDYPEAISRLSQQQTQLQASQQSFVKVNELRLFNYL